MSISSLSLFEGERVRLAPRDPARDPEIESLWTHDPEFSHLFRGGPARLLSPLQIKKRYTEDEKDKRALHFALRTRGDDRLVGHASLERIHWGHAAGRVSIGIGNPADRGQGYGREALGLMIRYAFDEISLFRLAAQVPENNARALHWLERAGFVVEVRSRQALRLDGRYWDLIYLGLLRSEWKR